MNVEASASAVAEQGQNSPITPSTVPVSPVASATTPATPTSPRVRSEVSTTSTDPPTYLSAVSSSAGQNYGFPPGYFIIRSVATGRLLDIEHNDVDDGTEVISWPEMESSLVEGFRKPEADNQVFFIDTTGALCSRQSDHAIDVEGNGRLVLRHRRPMSYPFPNEFSHPLPQFSYSPGAKQISVKFACDPTYPVPSAAGSPSSPTSTAWRQRIYLLISIPLRRPRSLLEDASDVFTGVLSGPLSLFGGSKPQTRPEEVFSSDIDLREEEVVDEDRAEGEEADDSPERLRRVRVFADAQVDESQLPIPAKNRRKWEIVPLRRSRALYSVRQ